MERRPFDKSAVRVGRRSEWVALDAGDVCVREMTVQEAMTLTERAARPAIDKRGGMDPTEMVLWQILLSCYVDDSEDAARLFSENDPADIRVIYSLRFEEFGELMGAINRVNGKDATEVDLLRDFTAARQGAKPLPS